MAFVYRVKYVADSKIQMAAYSVPKRKDRMASAALDEL
jgi:hypothetical protein